MKNYKALILALAMASLTACSSMGVEPWEREVLAKEEMQLESDPMEVAIDDHIYFSKEASSGGGCGCN